MRSIYFAGSIRGGRQLAENYRELIGLLSQFGSVLTEHVGDDGAISSDDGALTDGEIYTRDMEWIRSSDCLVAEVTVPSLGVGYEIARAAELGIPVLCLFRQDTRYRLSAMISGSPDLEVAVYRSIEEAGRIIREFLHR